MTVDGVLGVRCTAKSGDSTGIYAQSGTYMGSETAVIGIFIPLHPQVGNCKAILTYEEAAARLQLATTLLEGGTITPEQYNEIAQEVHQLISAKN